jgi:hypothetical protein
MSDQARPVQLQLNNSGAWKTLVRFDAGNEALAEKAYQAGTLLADINPDLGLRIATAEPLPSVLVRWVAGQGWKAVCR